MKEAIRQTQDEQANKTEELKKQPLVTLEQEKAERPYLNQQK